MSTIWDNEWSWYEHMGETNLGDVYDIPKPPKKSTCVVQKNKAGNLRSVVKGYKKVGPGKQEWESIFEGTITSAWTKWLGLGVSLWKSLTMAMFGGRFNVERV